MKISSLGNKDDGHVMLSVLLVLFLLLLLVFALLKVTSAELNLARQEKAEAERMLEEERAR